MCTWVEFAVYTLWKLPQKLTAESLCWERPKGLFPQDLANGMGFVLCYYGQ